MRENKKILFFIILVFIIIYFLINLINTTSKTKGYENTVFIGDTTKIKVINNGIQVYNDNVEIEKQDANFYFKNTIVEGYISSKNTGINNGKNEYYAYTKDGNVLLFDTTLIGYTKDLSLKFINIESELSMDSKEAYSVIAHTKTIIPSNAELSYLYKSSADIDSDGVSEKIYSIGLIEDNEKYESFVILNKGDNYTLIDKTKSDMENIKYTTLFLTAIIDFDNDGSYEFVIKRSMSEYGPTYYELYSFDGSEFTKIGGE